MVSGCCLDGNRCLYVSGKRFECTPRASCSHDDECGSAQPNCCGYWHQSGEHWCSATYMFVLYMCLRQTSKTIVSLTRSNIDRRACCSAFDCVLRHQSPHDPIISWRKTHSAFCVLKHWAVTGKSTAQRIESCGCFRGILGKDVVSQPSYCNSQPRWTTTYMKRVKNIALIKESEFLLLLCIWKQQLVTQKRILVWLWTWHGPCWRRWGGRMTFKHQIL